MAYGRSVQSPVASGRQRKMRLLVVSLVAAALVCGCVVVAKVSDGPAREAELAEVASPKELRLVHAIFRHGERTPADTYPNDEHINHTFHPFGWGQLTNVGKQNQFKIGQFLRKRYDNFLGELFTNPAVYAQSTGADRAFMGCALALAGLWPVKGTELEWNPDINWQPIPIRSQPINEDTLLLARKNCPRYYEELDNVYESPEVQTILNDNVQIFEEVTKLTGLSVKTPDDIQSVYSTLKAEEDYGLTLPQWTKNYYPHKLVPLTETSFIINVNNQELKRLKGGPLLKKLISDWTDKAKGKLSPKQRKIFIYSGHDSTVANLLLALGVWEKQIPGYNIMTFFELYEDVNTKEFGVEVYLRNCSNSEPTKLTIPGCEFHCPLTKLVELTRDVVPVNWEQECRAKNPDFVAPDPGGP